MDENNLGILVNGLVFVLSIVLVVSLIMYGCQSPKTAKRVLTENGYTQIEITGYKWFACDDKSDAFSTGFTAVSPYGKKVSGTVCGGFLKGNTIRFD